MTPSTDRILQIALPSGLFLISGFFIHQLVGALQPANAGSDVVSMLAGLLGGAMLTAATVGADQWRRGRLAGAAAVDGQPQSQADAGEAPMPAAESPAQPTTTSAGTTAASSKEVELPPPAPPLPRVDPATLNPLQRMTLWSAGPYTAAQLARHSHQDLSKLYLLGASVMFAAVFAAIMWFVAGLATFREAGVAGRVFCALLAALVGGTIVMLFDRTMIYLSDTQHEVNRVKSFGFAAFRLLFVFSIGGMVAAQVVVPIGNYGPQLDDLAAQMVQERRAEYQRVEEAAAGLQERIAALDSARKREQQLQADTGNALSQIKQGTQRKDRQCQEWTAALRAGGEETPARVEQLRRLRASCTAATTEETRIKAEHQGLLKKRDTLEAETKRADDQLQQAREKVAAEVNTRYQKDLQTLDRHNEAVMSRLLREDGRALFKWLQIMFVICALELLALLVKGAMGRTAVGYAVMVSERVENAQRMTVGVAQVSAVQDSEALNLVSQFDGRLAQLAKVDAKAREAAERTLSPSLQRQIEEAKVAMSRRLLGLLGG